MGPFQDFSDPGTGDIHSGGAHHCLFDLCGKCDPSGRLSFLYFEPDRAGQYKNTLFHVPFRRIFQYRRDNVSDEPVYHAVVAFVLFPGDHKKL